jgi:4-amino-4-deoxy-L-arabinose transferase-like glycosyltransferase
MTVSSHAAPAGAPPERPRSSGAAWLVAILERPRTVLTLAAIALLATTGAIDLIEPTEARYALIAQEMRRTGDYVTPHLNGLAYYHKPPFAYWTVAASFAALGENARAARIPVTLATMASLAFLLLAVRRRFGALVDSETVPLWVYATAILPFAVGRTLATDPFLTAAVLGYWALAPSPFAIALLGMGFFIKGPIVFVMTVLPVLAAALWGRDRSTLRFLGPWSGWALCAFVALPWYLIETLKTPGLLGYLLGYQLWDRYTTTVHGRSGPPWYFAAVALAGALPWTAALIAGIARVFARRAREDARLLLCWLIVPIAFLTPSGSKLPAYLLPCFGAVAILAAAGLERGRRGPLAACAVTLMALVVAGFVLGPAALTRAIGVHGASAPLPLAAVAALGVLGSGGIVMLRGPAVAAPLVLIGWVALVFAARPYESALGSPRPLADVLIENRLAGEPVVEMHRFVAGVPFYLREPVLLLDVERELTFTPEERRAAVLIDRDGLRALLDHHDRVWLLAPRDEGRALATSLGLEYARTTMWRDETLGTITRAEPLPR